MSKQVSDDMIAEVAFALSCYLDDYAKQIKKAEKIGGATNVSARARHARLQRWLLTEFNPTALRGKLKLMNGEIIGGV
jgi:hypothetical protein